jgi:DNA-binding transcriptional regulator YhcF (GntR family)
MFLALGAAKVERMARRDQADARASKEAGEEIRGTPRAQVQTPASEAQVHLEDLKIDRAGEIPIGVQLAWALRARIGDGRLAPEQRLPGLRELAEMLGINANTARAVYQRLEQEGLIDSRQGTGTFVASIAPEPSAVGQIAADAAQQARRTGVDPREVAAALYVTADTPTDITARATERRRELRAQIAALEQALSEIQARNPGLIPTPSKPLRHAGPRLLSVEELERVRGELVRRLAAAEPLLETPVQETRPARAHTSGARADTQAAPDKQAKAPVAKKATRARPRTRPSTA